MPDLALYSPKLQEPLAVKNVWAAHAVMFSEAGLRLEPAEGFYRTSQSRSVLANLGSASACRQTSEEALPQDAGGQHVAAGQGHSETAG